MRVGACHRTLACSVSLSLSVSLFVSEVLDICLSVAANGAAQRELRAVRRVIYFERTPLLSRTLWQFTCLFARNVVAIALAFVAGFAEVRVAPAEPLRNGAAELALKLDKICAMYIAVRCAEAKLLGGTLRAHQFFRLEFLCLILCSYAIFHAAKVGYIALVAGVVR